VEAQLFGIAAISSLIFVAACCIFAGVALVATFRARDASGADRSARSNPQRLK